MLGSRAVASTSPDVQHRGLKQVIYMSESTPSDQKFDVVHYWNKRHRNLEGLRATGTLGAPLGWQKWLYRGKLRAYLRGLRTVGFSLNGCSALNFGCGHGYFEDAWESLGMQLHCRHRHR